MFAFGMSAGLLLVAVTVSVSAAVSASPTVNASGPTVPLSGTTWFATGVIVGVSLTALTVTRNVRLVVVTPSLTVTVMVAVPLASGAGAKVRAPVLFGLA